MARFVSIHDRNFRPMLTRLDMFQSNLARQADQSTQSVLESRTSSLASVSTLFETPLSPCNTFRGREDVLSTMNSYFFGRESATSEQLSFVLCGLGGCGKTQTALQYATRNRHKYTSGVFFLNADSRTTLESDFARYQDTLELGHVSNKVESFKRWLSNEGNVQWLLIFDNADDLKALPIMKYYPLVAGGHILITSRDQGAIGTVGQAGLHLERLNPVEAIEVLLVKAGLKYPSPQELEDARAIVELVGCLALAVDQAGAFIRARHKTLAAYRRLSQERQHDLLRTKPRLGDYDKSVLSTWEMNFEQVELDSKGASNLLLLFCFLDGSNIPEVMLQRGALPQHRWGPDGEVSELAAADTGLDDDLGNLIADEMAFDEAIDKLLSFSLIHTSTDANGSRSFSVHPLVQYSASQRVPANIQVRWKLQALVLVTHAFPRSKYLEPRNGGLGRLQMPHVERVFNLVEEVQHTPAFTKAVRNEFVSMLLASSRFSSMSWKRKAVSRAKELLSSETEGYLHALSAYRESSLLRMLGKRTESNETLETFIHATAVPDSGPEIQTDARWNAQQGDLIISYAQNLIQDLDLVTAKKELYAWNPLSPSTPSARERIALRGLNTTLGKILRYEGHFEEALKFLEDQLQESEADDFYEGTGWRRVMLSEVSDLYCELKRHSDATALLEPELRKMTNRGVENIGVGRRLQLALVESFIGREMWLTAESRLLALKAVFEGMPDPDVTYRKAVFRIWASLARIAHYNCLWEKSLSHWEQALKALELHGWENSFNAGLVRYSQSYTLWKLDRAEEGRSIALLGKANLKNERRLRWIVGWNSYWNDYIVELVNQIYSL